MDASPLSTEVEATGSLTLVTLAGRIDRAADAALAAAKGEVEGVHTATAAAEAAERLGLELPLAAAVNDILHGDAEAGPTLEAVLPPHLELAAGLRLRA